MADLRYIPDNRKKAFAAPFYRDSPQAIFGDGQQPTLWSDHRDCMRFLEALSDKLTEAFPAYVDDQGFGGPLGVVGNFYPLRTVAGYLMDPATVPNPDNTDLRHELGLVDGYETTRHKSIAYEVAECMFATHLDANGPIATLSSSSFPWFTKDPEQKKLLAWGLSRDWAKISPLLGKRNLKALFQQFGILPSYRILMRAQADSVSKEGGSYQSKERTVPERAVALGKSDRLVKSDKRVYVSGSEVANHFAQRVRMVYAYTGAINYVLAAIMQRFRRHYLSRYEFTWKHRGAEHLQLKVANYATVAAFDVSRMDQTIAPWQLDPMIDVLSRTLTEETIDMLLLSLHAPCWVPDPRKGGTDHFWTGDPLDPKCYDAWWGIPSGIAPNPDFGKYVMTVVYLCILDDYFNDLLEFGVDKVLRGLHPDYAIANMGDDNVFMLADTESGRSLQQDLAEGRVLSKYMKVEQERGTKFLGNIIHKDFGGRIAISPDITSFFTNWFVPERGTQLRPGGLPGSRKFWPLGWRLRQTQYYQTAPTFGQAMDILKQTWKDYLPDYPQPNAWALNMERNVELLGSLTPIDAMVLDAPEKLFYQFEAEDVSPQVLEEFEGGFSEHDARILVTPFFKEKL